MINVFCHGSLVMENLGDSSTPHTGSILYGTVHGAIGMVTQLPQDFYDFLNKLQHRLCRVIRSVGKIEHAQWRGFSNDRKQVPMAVSEHLKLSTKIHANYVGTGLLVSNLCTIQGFIDGDLIETFLDLKSDKMAEVASGLTIPDGAGGQKPATVDELIKAVEDLTRIH